MKIFVVEDQKIILQGIQKMIENFCPAEVYAFQDAALALKELPHLRPNIVFTDIVMEGMDGLTLIRRAAKLVPDCRFVIISGFANFEYAQQAISLGVDSYLLKSIERQQLEGVLQKVSADLEERQKSLRHSLAEEAMVYIRTHSERPLTIRDVAVNIHISPNYLSSVFKKETGISVSEAIRSEQMKAAKRLLRNTNLYLYEIAERFGYKDVKYFSVLFREYFNMTPKSYRKLYCAEVKDEQDDPNE